MSKGVVIGGAIAIILVAIGAYVLMQPSTQPESIVVSTDTNSGVTDREEAPGPETIPNGTGTGTGGISTGVDVNAGTNAAPMTATVTYNGSSYSPASVTIKRGGTVTWKNTSSGSMWVASDSHPSHTIYDGTNRQQHCASPSANTFDQCTGGGDYSFTFAKAGKWGYHDHINASVFGSVTVVE